MRKVLCAREEELLEALQSSRWPEACGLALREHVASCASCGELLAVAGRLIEDQRALTAAVAVPSSAIVWWRAQMRSRREAAERAAQPVSVALGITVACAAGLLATALGIFVPTFRRALGWIGNLAALPEEVSFAAPGDALANPVLLAALAAAGLCAVIGPVVLYYVLRED